MTAATGMVAIAVAVMAFWTGWFLRAWHDGEQS